MSTSTTNNTPTRATSAGSSELLIRDNLQAAYADVYTPAALAAMSALAEFNQRQPTLLTHARTHPPLAVLHLLPLLGVGGTGGAGASRGVRGGRVVKEIALFHWQPER